MTPMTISHEIPHDAAARAGWPLAAGAARSLPAARTPRLLLVLCGQVWITERVADGEDRIAEDHWLAAGQTLALPAGSRWIVEAGPQRGTARLVLLEPPPARAGDGGVGAVSAAVSWPQAWRRALRQAWHALTARPASPAGPRAA